MSTSIQTNMKNSIDNNNEANSVHTVESREIYDNISLEKDII